MENIFELHLNDEYFDKILEGTKTIELRVNDAKRRKYEVGNILEFVARSDEKKRFKANIVHMYYFPSVRETIESLGKEKLGFSKTLTVDKIEDIYLAFYKQEDIDKNGMVAIEIEIIK